MSEKYYTYVGVIGDVLYHRYIMDGKRHIDVIDTYNYKLYKKDNSGINLSLYGDKVKEYNFSSISEMKNWIKKQKRGSIYGNTDPVQQFISTEYVDVPHISKDNALYRTLNFDIEVIGNDGFPSPEKARVPVTSISYEKWIGKEYGGSYYIGLREYHGDDNECNITILENEKQLLLHFLDVLDDFQTDFMTNWNGDGFDIPYLVKRILKLFGKETCKRLSPIYKMLPANINPIVKKRTESLMYDIFGLTNFDYMYLVKKFSMTKYESMKLDHVAYIETGHNKIKFDRYKNNLYNLYNGIYTIDEKEDVNMLTLAEKYCRLRTMVEKEIYNRGLKK